MTIGVLALQGAFVEHIRMLESLDVEAVEVRKPGQFADLDGLIIPGGESTVFGRLAVTYELIESMQALCDSDKPVWGTCAGMILLAKDVGCEQPRVGRLDVRIKRNAFGRQVNSFESDLDVPVLMPRAPFPGIFIRAPWIAEVGKSVEILARLDDGTAVAARQGNLLATSFHPELTDDSRFHRFFLSFFLSMT